MKFTIAMIATASATELMSHVDYKFMEFVTEHQRSYATQAEYIFRQALFAETLEIIEEQNSKNDGLTFGLNHLADMTHHEKKQMLGFKGNQTSNQKNLN